MNKFLLIAIISLSTSISSDEIRKVTYTNFQGELIEDVFGVGLKTYFYEDGKLVRLTYQDKEGNLIPGDRDINFYPSEFLYTYDARGNYIRREAFNASGEVIDLDGYYDSAILSYIYNDQDQLIERQTLDKDGKLLEMGDSKIAVIKYTYDESGNLTSVTNYDASGNILPSIAQYSYLPDGHLGRCVYLNESKEVDSEQTLTYNAQGLLDAYTQI
ncbi:MAG: hypothetical protein AAFU33_28420, partial [Bacteroidota bacterium]